MSPGRKAPGFHGMRFVGIATAGTRAYVGISNVRGDAVSKFSFSGMRFDKRGTKAVS